jgi:hypothetical protein
MIGLCFIYILGILSNHDSGVEQHLCIRSQWLLNISILYSVLAHSVLLASHVADDSIIHVVKSATKSTATR